MAKGIECTAVLNTSYGYCSQKIDFGSINEAVRYCKDTGYFAYRIFNKAGKLIKRGYC